MYPERAVDPALFDWPSEHTSLKGSRCNDCQNIAFPAASRCSRCSGDSQTPYVLSRSGILWSWTRQHFPPASPPFPPVTAEAPFTPFLLGYIELAGEVRVQARLYYPAGQTPQIGQSMQLVFEPLYRTEDGEQIIGYGFAPQEKQ